MKPDYLSNLADTCMEPDFTTSAQWAGQYSLRLAFNRKEDANDLREAWKNWFLRQRALPLPIQAGSFWQDIFEPSLSLDLLPAYSFFIQFRFRLEKPYLSKGTQEFYIIDNPLVKDKVLDRPIVTPTAWKGALRMALRRLGHWKPETGEDDRLLYQLFGESRGDDQGQAGRIFFYPTIFDRLGLNIINPHDREKRVGKNPILMECVPDDTPGIFTMLYVPFDLIGQSKAQIQEATGTDLKVIALGLQAMFRVYGFGAKTSSGFGVVKEALAGQGLLRLKAPDPAPPAEPAPQSAQPSSSGLARYLSTPDQLHPDFQTSEGDLKAEAEYRALIESRGREYTKADKKLYDKAKSWWEREGRMLAEQKHLETEPIPQAEEKLGLTMTVRTFETFDKMINQATKLASLLIEAKGELA